MHSILSRGSYASTKASRIVGYVAVVMAFIAYIQLYVSGAFSLTGTVANINPKVTLRSTRRSGSIDGKPKENLRVQFDLDANLETLFNWNTKQVFVYLTAEYPGARPDITNIVTLWDSIVRTKDAAHIQLRKQGSKYNVWDTAASFDNRVANLTLRWQVQPHVGLLVDGQADLGHAEFEIPGPTEGKQPKAPKAPKARA